MGGNPQALPSQHAPVPLQLRSQNASQNRGQEPQGPGGLKHRRWDQCGQCGRGWGNPGGWTGGSGPAGHHPLPSPARSSVCRLSSREKISLQDLSKERRPEGAGDALIRDDEDGEEGPKGRGASKIPGSEEWNFRSEGGGWPFL